jgi:predicted ATPase
MGTKFAPVLTTRHDRIDSYADGIFWAALSVIRDPELVLPTIAASLESEQTPAAHIGDKRMLLLLDNFEQVVAAAGDVAALLAVCPRLDVLVTSRERLHLAGEHVFAVPSLAERDSVSLFSERAVAVRSDFTADGDIVAICTRLDNLPLAIEIAAARVNVLSPRAILERLEHRLPLLTSNTRDAPERQRTLRATIEWSYELLTPKEQRLFRGIAVFAGGCTFEAAEQVCEADLDTLASLVDKSLLRYSDGRYWMLATIREFGHEVMAEARERDIVLRTHNEYFVELAERAESRFGTSDEEVCVEVLEREQDNVRAALGHTQGSPLQLRLACALWPFWLRRGRHSEGRKWLRSALSQRDDQSPVHLVGALIGAAALARHQGDLDEAERLVTESIAVAKNANDRYLEARGIGSLANVALSRGDSLAPPNSSWRRRRYSVSSETRGLSRSVSATARTPRSASATSHRP